MTSRTWASVAVLWLVAVGTACRPSATPPPDATATTAGPAVGTWGFDTTAMDTSVAPGDDFDRYANGAWQTRTTIPDDRQVVSMFTQVTTLVQSQLRTLFEEAAADRQAAPGSRRQILGDWYASFVDEAGIEAAGVKPLLVMLDRIAAIHTRTDLARFLGQHAGEPRTSALYWGVQPDAKDSRRSLAGVGVSGDLSLGAAEAYRAPAQASRRQQYLAHVERTFALAGLSDSKARAARAVSLEATIAAILPAPGTQPQGDAAYNLIPPAQFPRRFPGVEWEAFLAAADLASVPMLLVEAPAVLAAGAKLLAGEPLDAWHDYLAYQYIRRTVDVLPKVFRDEHFDFYMRASGLQAAMRPRHELAIELAQDRLVRFLSEEYATRFATPETKAAAAAMVDDIRQTFDERLVRASWLSESARAEARKKLAATVAMIGYPDQWPPALPLQVVRGEPLANLERAWARVARVERARLDRPADRQAWDAEFMGPYYVGATANAAAPSIVIMAGIMQPPFFDARADAAANYGGLGVVLAHEFTHLFDQVGRLFDTQGNQREWFTPADTAAFEAMSGRLAAQMAAYEVLPGVFVDGKHTITETMADLGGLHIGLDAYHRSLRGTPAPVIEGLTGDQRFFLAFAQNWRATLRDERTRQMTQGGDSHPVLPLRPRMVRNIDAWYEAFAVRPGQRLYLPASERLMAW